MTRFTVKDFRRYPLEWVAAVIVALLCVAAISLFVRMRPARYSLSVSAGSRAALRDQLARRLVEQAVAHHITFRLNPGRVREGSKDVLDDIDAGNLDIGLVQGGLDPAVHPHVRQIAAFHNIEPLHLLVKPSLVASASQNLGVLRGHVVNTGPAGSGTHDLAREVLEFAGLEPARADGRGDYHELRLGQEALSELSPDSAGGQRPDAIFIVSALPSPVVRHLVDRDQYQLVPLSFCDAFALDPLDRGHLPVAAHVVGTEGDISKTRIYPIKIPRFTYGMNPPMPADDLPTFGPRLLLVANEQVEARAVCQVLETVLSPAFAHFSSPPLDARILESGPEYPLHPGAEEYMETTKPMPASEVLDRLEKMGSLGAVILSAAFFLWQWARQYYRRQRDLGFESYMLKVAEIEDQALALEMEARLELKELLRLQLELGRLRNEALARFADGTIAGRDLISGFVSHVNEARNYLNRLILHERENMEERAAKERRSAESVWKEALEEPNGRATFVTPRGEAPPSTAGAGPDIPD
jgi:TRAP-type uncharacterized transport system substrate-binding protein